MNSLVSINSRSKGMLLFNKRLLQPALAGLSQVSAQPSSAQPPQNKYNFETLIIHRPSDYVFHVEINRPNKMNAMNKSFWREIRNCFIQLDHDPDCRAVVLSGAGKMFSAGIDLMDMGEIVSVMTSSEDVARKAKLLKKTISEYQQSFTVIDKCQKPVIAAIHNACIGGGVNMIASCDICYCTKDAWFQIKEVELGLAADVGALQRMPKNVGNGSLLRELALTARKFYSDEALQLGFVSRILPDKEQLMKSALDLAQLIASKSPVAVQGTKINLNYSRDHSVDEALHFMAHWNMTMLQSEDLMKAVQGVMDKSQKPSFSKL